MCMDVINIRTPCTVVVHTMHSCEIYVHGHECTALPEHAMSRARPRGKVKQGKPDLNMYR